MSTKGARVYGLKTQRVKDLIFGSLSFEGYMAGRHLQSRDTNMGRARFTLEAGLRKYYVHQARDDHHRFLECITKIACIEKSYER